MSQQSSSVWHWMRKRVGGVFKTVICVGWYAIDICSLGQKRLQGKEMLLPIRQVWASLGRGKEGPRIRHRWHRLTILHLLDLCVAQQPKTQALGPLILSVEIILISLLSLFVDIRFWSQWILLRVFLLGGFVQYDLSVYQRTWTQSENGSQLVSSSRCLFRCVWRHSLEMDWKRSYSFVA